MRLIDADALIEDLKHDVALDQDSLDYEELTDSNREIIQFDKDCKQNAIDLLQNAPTIEPQRKTGKWIERNPQNSDKCRLIECDKCGFSHIVGFNVPYEHWIENRNFCERCGADMRGNDNG